MKFRYHPDWDIFAIRVLNGGSKDPLRQVAAECVVKYRAVLPATEGRLTTIEEVMDREVIIYTSPEGHNARLGVIVWMHCLLIM